MSGEALALVFGLLGLVAGVIALVVVQRRVGAIARKVREHEERLEAIRQELGAANGAT